MFTTINLDVSTFLSCRTPPKGMLRPSPKPRDTREKIDSKGERETAGPNPTMLKLVIDERCCKSSAAVQLLLADTLRALPEGLLSSWKIVGGGVISGKRDTSLHQTL